MTTMIPPLRPQEVVAPLLPALPGAAIASRPAPAVLPLLAPILRHRVLFLSEEAGGGGSDGSDENRSESASAPAPAPPPWIRLLAYDAAEGARLVDIARSARFEPHPVSGEVELDWEETPGGDGDGDGDGDVAVRYRRRDVETLEALVLLRPLGLMVRAVYCADEGAGGDQAWRVGEVSTADEADAFGELGGHATVAEAEAAFRAVTQHAANNNADNNDDDDDDDDDYWARYDATPARTPGAKHSPAPQLPAKHTTAAAAAAAATADDDDAYFALYDNVQPAMDSHDPDEVVDGMDYGAGAVAAAAPAAAAADLVHHPRPDSAASSGGPASASETTPTTTSNSTVVTKLEASAARREQGAFGVKQHVARSIKSLYLLARTAGIEREEFAQLVQTEVAMLALMEE